MIQSIDFDTSATINGTWTSCSNICWSLIAVGQRLLTERCAACRTQCHWLSKIFWSVNISQVLKQGPCRLYLTRILTLVFSFASGASQLAALLIWLTSVDSLLPALLSSRPLSFCVCCVQIAAKHHVTVKPSRALTWASTISQKHCWLSV